MFSEEKGTLKIGGAPIDEQLRNSLREEAKVIEASRFWEVLHATIIQEAADLALVQSANWEHIQSAKMLKHWDYVFQNMIYKLGKK